MMHSVQRLGVSAPESVFLRIGELHVEHIHHGILEALGAHFVGVLYQELSRREGLWIYVVGTEGYPAGFLAGSSNLSRSLRNISPAGFLRLFSAAGLRLFQPRLARKVFQSLGYFLTRPTTTPDPESTSRAELLAIAVAQEVQGQGVGKALLAAFEADLAAEAQVNRYFVSTNIQETGSNAFYQATGFQLRGQKPHHDLILNVYSKDLPQNPSNSKTL